MVICEKVDDLWKKSFEKVDNLQKTSLKKFIVEGNTVRIVNSAVYAMQVLQKTQHTYCVFVRYGTNCFGKTERAIRVIASGDSCIPLENHICKWLKMPPI